MVRMYEYYWLVKHFPEKKLRDISPSFFGVLLDVGSSDRPYSRICGSYLTRYISLDIAANKDIDVRADALRLPFKNGSIDAVLCVDVLYFLTEPWDAFAEFERVLRPGGRLVVFASQSWRTMDDRNDYYRFTKNGLSYLARRVGLTVVESGPLDGFWAKMGAQINYYILRFHKRSRPCTPFFKAAYLMTNGVFYLLNKINNIEVETINNYLIAVKGDASIKKPTRSKNRAGI